MHRLLFSNLFGTLAVFGQFQHVKLGVKGGGYFTDFYNARNSRTSSGQYTVGPSVEVFLRKDISIEANALFRPYSTAGGFGIFANNITEVMEKGNSLEVPILFKKYFGNGPVRPFAGIGPNIRRLFNRESTFTCYGCGQGVEVRDGKPKGSTTLGGTVAAGIELPKFGPRWTLEFRYSLYQVKYTSLAGGKEDQHQAGVFLGITF